MSIPELPDDDTLTVLGRSERRRRARLRAHPCHGETPEQTRARRTQRVKALAREAGFSRVGIAPAVALVDERAWLERWLAAGRHGAMAYMAEEVERRCDPGQLVQGARAVVMLALDYDSALPRTAEVDLRGEDRGWISRYAWGTDYHVVAERRLKRLEQAIARELGAELGEDFRTPGIRPGRFKSVRDLRYYVDHGALLERPLAVQAGLGWRGKHSLVIHPEHGSFFFLASLVTTIALDPDAPMTDHCGSCSACIEACPTGAIVEAYVVDARRCISYATIEVKGEMPADQRALVGDHVFGCDLCQDACPWNRFSKPSGEVEFEPRDGAMSPKLAELESMTEGEFAERFGHSALKRRGFEGLMDNVAAVRGSRGDRS